MMMGQGDKQPDAGFIIPLKKVIGFPVKKRPLGTEVLVSKLRRVAIVLQMILELLGAFCVHAAGVPITRLGHALRTPVRPDS